MKVDPRGRHHLWRTIVASGLAMPLSGCGGRTVAVTGADTSATASDAAAADTTLEMGAEVEPDSSVDDASLPDLGPPDDVEDASHPHIK